MTRTHGAFSEVAEHASKVGELVAEIAAASNEQAQGIEQVNTAVTEMDRVVQQNSANAEESASASETMNTQADKMKTIVEDLMRIVAGSRQTLEKKGGHQPRLTSHAASPANKRMAKAPLPDRKATPEEIIPMGEDDFKDF